jgi:hypothetical protein
MTPFACVRRYQPRRGEAARGREHQHHPRAQLAQGVTELARARVAANLCLVRLPFCRWGARQVTSWTTHARASVPDHAKGTVVLPLDAQDSPVASNSSRIPHHPQRWPAHNTSHPMPMCIVSSLRLSSFTAALLISPEYAMRHTSKQFVPRRNMRCVSRRSSAFSRIGEQRIRHLLRRRYSGYIRRQGGRMAAAPSRHVLPFGRYETPRVGLAVDYCAQPSTE